jgi:hypothetical protein
MSDQEAMQQAVEALKARGSGLMPVLAYLGATMAEMKQIFGALQSAAKNNNETLQAKVNAMERFFFGTTSGNLQVSDLLTLLDMQAKKFNAIKVANDQTDRTLKSIRESYGWVSGIEDNEMKVVDAQYKAENEMRDSMDRLETMRDDILNTFLSWMHHMRKGELLDITNEFNNNVFRMKDQRERLDKGVKEVKKIVEVWLKMAPRIKHRVSVLRQQQVIRAGPAMDLFLSGATSLEGNVVPSPAPATSVGT